MRMNLLGLYSKPRPLVDRNDMIMTVVAGAPKHNALWWDDVVRGAVKDLEQVHRDSDFSDVEGQAHLRFGITFGEDYAVSSRPNPTITSLLTVHPGTPWDLKFGGQPSPSGLS
jgi:hypothetical protein